MCLSDDYRDTDTQRERGERALQKQKRESNVMFWQQKKKGNAGAQKKKELEQNKHHVIDFTEIR
jgi:hypothetical protein